MRRGADESRVTASWNTVGRSDCKGATALRNKSVYSDSHSVRGSSFCVHVQCLERFAAAAALVHDAAQSPDVRLVVVWPVLAQFRTEIVRCTHACTRKIGVGAQHTSDAEITDFQAIVLAAAQHGKANLSTQYTAAGQNNSNCNLLTLVRNTFAVFMSRCKMRFLCR